MKANSVVYKWSYKHKAVSLIFGGAFGQIMTIGPPSGHFRNFPHPPGIYIFNMLLRYGQCT